MKATLSNTNNLARVVAHLPILPLKDVCVKVCKYEHSLEHAEEIECWIPYKYMLE